MYGESIIEQKEKKSPTVHEDARQELLDTTTNKRP